MGFCVKHGQSYSEQMGGYCPYCGHPNQVVQTWITNGTGNPPPAPAVEIGGNGQQPTTSQGQNAQSSASCIEWDVVVNTCCKNLLL